jgi:Ca2+-binding EF-hand superfamily protein
MRDVGMVSTYDDIEAFFRAVDLDQDGRITYTELIEAVHLMEPLPYEADPLSNSSSLIRRYIRKISI